MNNTLTSQPQTNPKVRAYSNIALIKYWGKADVTAHLPYNSSLSLSVDKLYTETEVKIIDAPNDVFYLNGNLQTEAEHRKLSQYLDKVRTIYNCRGHLQIASTNSFPTAAGLASSASGYAALAKALDLVYKLNLNDQDTSSLARLGSVSAARSIFGGFVSLKAQATFATPCEVGNPDLYSMLFIIINPAQKSFSSRQGMAHTVATSAYYQSWLETTAKDYAAMKTALATDDFHQIGAIMESNCLKMHATTLAANPPFTYLEPETLAAIAKVQNLRHQGLEVYLTIDAGPNIKLLYQRHQKGTILTELSQCFQDAQLIDCNAAKGYEIIA